jgi:transaldolase
MWVLEKKWTGLAPRGAKEVTVNATTQLHRIGQSLWLDNITRAMLNDGTLEAYIREQAVTGLTSNPTIFERAIDQSTDYGDSLAQLASRRLEGDRLFFELAIEDLRRAADLFRASFDRTNGVDGWASLEVSPLLAYDEVSTIKEAAALHERAGRKNVFIKIPGTPQGARAIEESIFAGVPINVTLLFSDEQYLAAADAYMRGIERRVDAGLNPSAPSVASVFVSRWDQAVADRVPDALRGRLGVAVAKRSYAAYRKLLDSDRWLRLANEGARPQRLLWASTGTKDPDLSDVLYVEALAAPFTISTMPDTTLKAFADHGKVGEPIPPDGGDADEVLREFAKIGIDRRALAAKLQRDGAEAFTRSWKSLLERIEESAA